MIPGINIRELLGQPIETKLRLAAFQALSEVIGVSVDELKIVSSFLISYPLAAGLKRIPDSKPFLKNTFIIGTSLFYLIGLFDLWSGIAMILLNASTAYLIAAHIKGPYMPWIVFVILMGHLSVSHIYRQMVNDASAVDVTGVQMVLVMKLTSFCWSVHDGRLPDKHLVQFQREHAVQVLPKIQDYLGYVFFFPSLFAGPSFDYVDYQRWIETTMFDIPPGTDPSMAPRTRKRRRIPRSGTPAMKRAVAGLLWVAIFLIFSQWYNTGLVLGDDFIRYGFLRRIWILEMLGFTARLKYYGVWSLTEGACILSGLGYNGLDPVTGRVLWNRLQNVNPYGIETAQNSRAYLENWNMNTNHWLRNCVYLRVTPKGKKPGFRASLATFVTSAFWHGFYPGYYLTFVLAAFIQTVAKNFRRFVRPFFLTPDGKNPTRWKPFYDASTYLLTQTIFSFTTAPFLLLDLPSCILVWSRVHFYAIVLVGLSMAFFSSPGSKFVVDRLQAYQGRKSPLESHAGIREDASLLGLPSDPARDFDEIVKEIQEEVETRRRRGSLVKMPEGKDLVQAMRRKNQP